MTLPRRAKGKSIALFAGWTVVLTTAVLAAFGVVPLSPRTIRSDFAEWNPPAQRADSTLRFRLAWEWQDDGAGPADSFEIQVHLQRGQGGNQLVVNRTVRVPGDTFSTALPANSEQLKFSGTLRAYRHDALSVPVVMTWQYPKPAGQEVPVEDPSDAGRQLVEFPTLSFSPRRAPNRTPVSPPVTEAPRQTPPPQPPRRDPEPVTRPSTPSAPLGAGGNLTSCGNEPAGFDPIAREPWENVPPKMPDKTPAGWMVNARPERFRVMTDPSAPSASKRVLEGRFPQGAPGGRGPFRLDLRFPRNVTSFYMCMWMKLSDNFTNNGNNNVKFSFMLTPYEDGAKNVNHYFNLTNRLGVHLQSSRSVLNRQMQSTFTTLRNLGSWHKVEYLVQSNTRGMNNGIARIWVDGRSVLLESNVQYFFPEQEPAFRGVTWNPTYGGGLNPVPYDLYQWISDWYVSGR